MNEKEGDSALQSIQLISWSILAIMTAASFPLFGFQITRSIFLGGILANVSFWFLQRDLTRLLQGPLNAVKSRFLIKYYLRLTVLALLLYFLISEGLVHFIGLLFGLSTVLVSIITLAVNVLKKTIHTREAS
ncbi:MAG: ATP synthase subunit I [Proteobacteria bacterium]|nr:ATP synthase subunit I [Pseudomonadota bacterium]